MIQRAHRPQSAIKESSSVASPVSSCSLSVRGMDCASCADGVTRALSSLDGVEDVSVDVVGGRVKVAYVPARVAQSDMATVIERLGYSVESDASHRLVFTVDGMDCADEVRLIEGKLGEVPAVAKLDFDLIGRRLTVYGDVKAAEIERAIQQLGMRARPSGQARPDEGPWWRQTRTALCAVSGALWLGCIAAEQAGAADWTTATLAIFSIVAGGWFIVPRGVRAAVNRALDMNFLMSVAAVGGVLIGEYEEAASAMFLFAVAQLLETYSMDRARNAIRALMDLSPAEATVLRDGRERRVPADQVQVGETVVIRPGEKIPVDGEVLTGSSAVNQSPITGESIPIDKEPGADVFAGTLNGPGVLEVRSTKPAADTTLARIIHSVEEAQTTRAPSQTFVDRFARIYTPAVVAVAIGVALLPPLLGLGAWGMWIYRALVLLVVACPCALVISTPVTIVSALAGAARRGILIKGGLHLENAGRVRVVALDKTGTLTEGRPAVTDVRSLDGTPVQTIIALAAAAEARSEHPIARAITEYAAAEGVWLEPATETSAIPGKGLRARVGHQVVHLGNPRLFAELGTLDEHVRATAAELQGRGRTVILIGTEHDNRVTAIGIIGVADQIRPEAAGALQALHREGIRTIAMLTGDNEGTAQAVAQELGGPGRGIDLVRAGLMPEEKVEALRELQRTRGAVLFVGDGVNDAPALAAADVGVAMGTAGTDVALETADIALMADDLGKLSETIRLARKAERIVRTNITFALATKAVFVVLALAGYATLWMAVAADMGASLLVVGNGLRALRS